MLLQLSSRHVSRTENVRYPFCAGPLPRFPGKIGKCMIEEGWLASKRGGYKKGGQCPPS